MALTNDIHDRLFQGLANELLKRLEGGVCEHCGRSGATHQELAQIRQLLNDNGITAVARPGTPLHRLTDRLPTFDPDVERGLRAEAS